MKKTALILLLFLGFVQANVLTKATSYDAALAQAIKEKKNLMVLITTENCKYCKKMKRTTFAIPKVIERIEKSYIFVEVTRFKDKYPRSLKAIGVPTTYFLYNNGTPIMRGVLGYWNSIDFLSFMDDADRKIVKKDKGL
ncbi:MAG: thioredoxin family protein [Thiovulaceae bacterium]|nr:thioredoxin family protein [Sulfurimonadaceae bacterium]